ncbi:hypothetical protein K466DRAFT_182426 [Polyporus arcularius HHB13444]|uniref:Uncharacterized protein n=1 Tax=Polyporus arcularius HHB13444 TaxID=1314778 RepID=A0A5C3PT24_9APHY|nr:hypothetical protein K466DRAFT_182426 [Polyporus arcularius HHB13444]
MPKLLLKHSTPATLQELRLVVSEFLMHPDEICEHLCETIVLRQTFIRRAAQAIRSAYPALQVLDVEVKHDYPNSQPRAGITPAEERKRLEEEVQGFYNALKCDFATVHVEVSEFFFKPERPIDIGSKIGVDELTVPSERFVEPGDLADLAAYFQDHFKADNEQ